MRQSLLNSKPTRLGDWTPLLHRLTSKPTTAPTSKPATAPTAKLVNLAQETEEESTNVIPIVVPCFGAQLFAVAAAMSAGLHQRNKLSAADSATHTAIETPAYAPYTGLQIDRS